MNHLTKAFLQRASRKNFDIFERSFRFLCNCPALLAPAHNLRDLAVARPCSFLRSSDPISRPKSMASMASGSAISIKSRPHSAVLRSQEFNRFGGLRSISFSTQRISFKSIRSESARLLVLCAAKPETVEKVIGIVKKQLVLADDASICGDSKFSELGADSLDTVEIVMGIEAAFDVSVEEDNAQSIVTVQDAADMIDKLLETK